MLGDFALRVYLDQLILLTCLECVKFARTRVCACVCVSSLCLSYLECMFICLFLLLILLPILFLPLGVPTLSLCHSPAPFLLSGEHFRIHFSLTVIPPSELTFLFLLVF